MLISGNIENLNSIEYKPNEDGKDTISGTLDMKEETEFNIDLESNIDEFNRIEYSDDDSMIISGTVEANSKRINVLQNGYQFYRDYFNIYVTQPAHGRIEIDGKVGTIFKYPKGTNVKIEAIADEGYAITDLFVDPVTNTLTAKTIKKGEENKE